MYWYSGRTSILMTELYVGATLANSLETELLGNGNDLAWF